MNPFHPPAESAECEPKTNDPPAHGCAIAATVFALGGVAAVMLSLPGLSSSLRDNRATSDWTDGLGLLVLGGAWIGAAILARQMNAFVSLALAVAGAILGGWIWWLGRIA